MRTHAIARTAQAKALTAQYLLLQHGLVDGLTPTETAFMAGIRSLLINCLMEECGVAAKKFLEAAPTVKAVRRRAYALLRLAGNAIEDIASPNNESSLISSSKAD